jgi:hypothetical protein
MKRLALLLLLPLTVWGQSRSVTISAPSQVVTGQSFTVPTSASTSFGGGELIGFYHGQYSTNGGASWTWFSADVNPGTSATRNVYITAGAAGTTIIVRLRIAFRGGAAGDVDYNGSPINWGGSWDGWQTPPTRYAYISVAPPPNQPPTVAWVQNPASAYVNQWFPVQGRANDGDGNLTNIWVWREWVPHAVNNGGNGYENYSDPNLTYSGTPGSVTFQAQSFDYYGASSAVIYHTTNIANRAPSGTFTINGSGSNATVAFGQTVSIASTVSDPDGNMSVHSFWWDQGSSLYWTHPYRDWNYPPNTAGWLNLNLGANGYDASGSSSTRSFDFRATKPAVFAFHNVVADPYTWVGVGPASVLYLTVNQATPAASFPAKSFAGTHTLTAADLNATFANPYSAAVAAPTGSVSYSVVSASGAGASPASGAVSVGTTLTPGNYTIRASYSGDANYTATTADAAFTIWNTDPRITMSASPTSIIFGQTTGLTSLATDADGNLAFHGILVLNQSGTDWYRPAGTDHSTGWGNHPVSNDFTAVSYSSGVTSGASSTRTATHRPPYAGSFTYHNNTHDGYVWASSNSANWAACVGYAYVTVNKATPTGNFAARTLNPAGGSSYVVQAGDLNASFANPYSAAVAAPTGAITYSIVGPGTLVTAGTNLTPGATYTIRASYPGDANYNAAIKDATWTITNDSDADGIPDGIEQQLGTNPNAAAAADPANTTQLKITRPQ